MSVLSFFLAVVSLVSPVPNESRIREIAAMLPEKPSFCDPNGLMRGDMHDSAEARKLAGTQIGPFAVDLYREFAINGNRKRFETWRDRHLSALTTFVSAESSERQGRFVPQIVARLDAICSWPSWALSAHDRNMDILEGRAQRIDIVSSELARQLACVISTLGDELPTACVRRIRDEIDRRIFRPYLDSPQDQWWFLGKNNWNAVCHAGCVIAALELIDSPSTRARFVEGAERGSVVFLDYGFAADGYCSEGMGYWNYGFGNFIDLGIAVRQVTGGKVDYFRHSQAIKVMRYASAYQLERGISPLFADGAVNAKEAVVQRGLGVWPELRPEFEGVLPLRSAFPDGQVWLMRLPAGESERFALAFKGGHNAEHHNHNDVGSYCIFLGGSFLAGDVGGEIYTARTFGSHRYDSKVLNSYGHPVPRVGGTLQQVGRNFAAKVLETDFSDTHDVVVLDLSGAYVCPSLKKLLRTFAFDRVEKTATVTDSVSFANPTAFESPYITLVPDELKGHVGIAATGGMWKRVEDVIDNPGRSPLHRMAVRFEEPVSEATVSFVFSAASRSE